MFALIALPAQLRRCGVFAAALLIVLLAGQSVQAGCNAAHSKQPTAKLLWGSTSQDAGNGADTWRCFDVRGGLKRGMWRLGPVVRIYEGGKFYYLPAMGQVGDCQGPNCKAPQRKQQLGTLPLVETQRVSLVGNQATAVSMQFGDLRDRIHLAGHLYCPLYLDGILRPPRS